MDKTIQDLLLSQSISVFQGPYRPHIVCPLGVVEQKDKFRMIYDARYLNDFLIFPKFKYEDLSYFDQFMQPNDYQWKFGVPETESFNLWSGDAVRSDYSR
jgi:hypothetical protein